MNDLRKPPGNRESAAHLTIWQVNFADDQILELTQAEIEQDIAAGNLSRENWVWREGMASWLPISDAPEFAKALSAAAPTSDFRARPDDEVESIPLDPEDDEKTVALQAPSFLAAYERPASLLEFSIEGDAETAEPPTSRAPAVTSSVVPSRSEHGGGDKTPAYGSNPLRPAASGATGRPVPPQPATAKISPSPIVTPPAVPKGATAGRESPPPLPPRKPVIPVSKTSSPHASPRPVPQAELAVPRPMPVEPLSATPAPPPEFEDLGLLIPEEMKSDAVWPAPDPALARAQAQAAETPLPLVQKAPSTPVAEPAKSPSIAAAPAQQALPTLQKDAAKARPAPAAARPLANEPAVIVAGPSETLPAAAEPEQAPPPRDVTPKAPVKSTPPITVRELPAAKAQLVDIKSSELVNEATLITGRRRTRHWVSMTNAVIGAICAACIGSALTALVMQATEQARLGAGAQPVAAAAAPPAAVAQSAAPPATPAQEKQPGSEPSAASAGSAQPAESATLPLPAVTPEPKPEVAPEGPVAARAPSVPAAKRRPAQKASTNPYDDYEPAKTESSKRAPAKAPASDDPARSFPSNPGF